MSVVSYNIQILRLGVGLGLETKRLYLTLV